MFLILKRDNRNLGVLRQVSGCPTNQACSITSGLAMIRGTKGKAIFVYNSAMALVAFLRGVNVGGHRTFRPSLLARELSEFGVVNVGAAGTFVVRKPGSRAKFRDALLSKLPFEAHLVLCDGRDLLRLEENDPFAAE